jgi:alpha-tubulin suppressor-like RCC1 family protein
MIRIHHALKSSRAAIDLVSIMVGIIVIGLIGGVIAATVFAVIPWSQDKAAKQQLDSIASAESAYRGLSADKDSSLKDASSSPTNSADANQVVLNSAFTGSKGLSTNNLLQESDIYCVISSTDGADYTAYVKSGSGAIYTRNSKSPTYQVQDTRSTCLGDITNGALPGTTGNAGSGAGSGTGTGSGSSGGGTTTPTVDPTAFTASSLVQGSMKYGSSYAIASDGIYGWGDNNFGRVDPKNTTKVGTSRVITSPQLVLAGDFVQITSSNTYTVAVTRTGDVYTWGGISSYSETPITKLSSLSNIAKVALGEKHLIAMTKTGGVVGYGVNDFGQVGNRSTTAVPASAPVTILTNAGPNPIIDIAATQRASAVLRADGEVDTWGNNTSNELGNGTLGGTMTYPTRNKMPVTNGISIQAANSTFAVLTSDGKAFVWGDNSTGIYADGTTTSPSTAATTAPRQIASLADKNIKKLVIGPYASYAIDANNTTYSWGYNQGKLGNGTSSAQYTPTALTISGETIKDATSGFSTTFLLTDSGKIYGVGNNSKYELGQGPGDSVFKNSPTLIKLIPTS